MLGLSLSIGGTALHAYMYAVEVPEGYQPISFAGLQPDRSHPELPVAPEALTLNGQRVFIKGYVHPGVSGSGPVKTFVLVNDIGTCCFGGQPKLTHMIEVTMRTHWPVQYSQFKRHLGGVLKVDTRLKPVDGLQGVYYQLEADYLK